MIIQSVCVSKIGVSLWIYPYANQKNVSTKYAIHVKRESHEISPVWKILRICGIVVAGPNTEKK